jgi:hypothetical protein
MLRKTPAPTERVQQLMASMAFGMLKTCFLCPVSLCTSIASGNYCQVR